MASTRHSDSDGSDIFWPGYVDAIANLVLNLLFLLTIMTIAVFMFALELGRASKGGPDPTQSASVKKAPDAAAKAAPDVVKENIALKREIELLKMKLAQQPAQKVRTEGPTKTVDVTSNVPKPLNVIEKTIANDFEIIVRFTEEAVAFTKTEHNQLLESLKPIVSSGKANLFVEVPVGFSEAKRMGFYRAMAVRNLLLEMKMPKDKINVSVVEAKSNANAAIVRVRSR
jgi:hypothetical protein